MFKILRVKRGFLARQGQQKISGEKGEGQRREEGRRRIKGV